MTRLACEACGAPLTADGRCEYCGARYRLERGDTIRVIQVEHPKVQTIAMTAAITKELAARYPDEAGRIVLRDMTRQMAESLAAFMKIERSEDPCRDAIMIRGTIRVVEPDFMF